MAARLILFKSNYYRYNVNIHDCFPLERKHIVLSVERPWANGLTRLLADRRLKKGELADLADVRAGTISAVVNSPKSPDIATLQRLAEGLTAHDRQGNPAAPAVGLWEFFVNDEQSAILREASATRQQLVKQEDLAALVIKELAPAVASAIAKVTATASPAPQQAPSVSAPEHAPPAEHPARGGIQRRRKTA